MTIEEFNLLLPYEAICMMRINEGIYVGGAESLVPVYERIFNTKVNTSCSNCISDMLIQVGCAIKRFRKENDRITTTPA